MAIRQRTEPYRQRPWWRNIAGMELFRYMFLSFRVKVMVVVALLVAAAVAVFLFRPGGGDDVASDTTVPAEQAPPTSAAVTDDSVDAVTPTTQGPSETVPQLTIDPAVLAEVETMVTEVVSFENLDMVLESVDVPNGLRAAIDGMQIAIAEQFPDVSWTTEPIRAGLSRECGDRECLVVDTTITVPSKLFTATLQIVVVEQGDRWVVTRESLCKIPELAGSPCV